MQWNICFCFQTADYDYLREEPGKLGGTVWVSDYTQHRQSVLLLQLIDINRKHGHQFKTLQQTNWKKYRINS